MITNIKGPYLIILMTSSMPGINIHRMDKAGQRIIPDKRRDGTKS